MCSRTGPWVATAWLMSWRAFLTMDSPPKLTGETLIVHHIPLVHCQVPDRQCCSVNKRTNPFCQPDLGITRTSTLPERDLSQTDSLVYSSFLQTSESSAEASDNKEGKARDLVVPSASKHISHGTRPNQPANHWHKIKSFCPNSTIKTVLVTSVHKIRFMKMPENMTSEIKIISSQTEVLGHLCM